MRLRLLVTKTLLEGPTLTVAVAPDVVPPSWGDLLDWSQNLMSKGDVTFCWRVRRYGFSSARTPAWAYGLLWQLGSHVALTRVRRFSDSPPPDTGNKGQTLLKGPSMCLFYVRLSSHEEEFKLKQSVLNVSVGPHALTGQTNDCRRWLTSRPPRNVISSLQMFPLWQKCLNPFMTYDLSNDAEIVIF